MFQELQEPQGSHVCGPILVPSSVKRIGTESFSGAQVDEIVVPNSVVELSHGCFVGSVLCNYHIPASVEHVGGGAFSGCTLKNDICGDCDKYCVLDSLLVEKTSLCVMSLLADVSDVCIPSCICELSDGCFKKSAGLLRVTFCTPSSVERIGIESFSGKTLWNVSI